MAAMLRGASRPCRAPLALLVAGVIALLGGCRGQPAEEGEVWAEVNGQPILRAQVEKYYQQQVRALPEPLTPEEALARKLSILNELIQNEILWQKASQAGRLPSDGEVEARFQQLRTPFTEEEFQRQLSAQGMTPDELKAELRREIAIRKLLDQNVSAGVQVTDQEIADYYEQNRNRFRFVETQYRVAEILVTPRAEPEMHNLRNDDAASEEEARRKTQLLLERLRAGDDFAELARGYSEDPDTTMAGGDLGFFPESDLANAPPALRAAVQRLEVGQVAGPIQTPRGYYLIKLLERLPPGQRELSDPKVRQAIRDQLRHQKRQLLEAAYIEQVRSQARVVNYLARHILESHGVSP